MPLILNISEGERGCSHRTRTKEGGVGQRKNDMQDIGRRKGYEQQGV